MEFDRVLPENVAEIEIVGKISVHREYPAYTEEGVPVAEPDEFCSFDSLKKALVWVSSMPKCRYQVDIPLAGVGLVGYLSQNSEINDDELTLSTPERSGISPCGLRDMYMAITDHATFLGIAIVLEKEDEEIFAEGISTLSLFKSGPPVLQFVFRGGQHSYDDLSAGMDRMLKRANFVLDKLLNGIYENPKE